MTDVKTVYAVFKCHFDLGFTDTQDAVVRTFCAEYLPLALRTATKLRELGGEERYTWTTGSWLLYRYLQEACPEEQARIAEAIARGDLAYHALPFTLQSEVLDRPLFEASLDIAGWLDRRFGQRTTGAKTSDVPGQSRGIIDPLVAAGITFLDIGVNPASTPPDVPPIFRWRSPSGAELIVLYHTDYGGAVVVPGGEIAVSLHVSADNSGVHSLDEIHEIYGHLRRQFPNARIIAAGLSAVADALAPFRSLLPVVASEIGDTWIHGCASDPVKMARFRELSRLHRQWRAQGKLAPDDRLRFVSDLILAAEHTWGCDIKTALGDWDVYTPAQLQAARSRPNFARAEATWAEKRGNLDRTIASLPPALATEARVGLAALTPREPERDGLVRLEPSAEIETERFMLALDPVTGAVVRLRDRRTGREWASPENPLGLFSYQTFSAGDYDRFFGQYLTRDDWWPPQDFGKPGLDRYPVASRTYTPRAHKSFVGRMGAASRIVTALCLPDAGDQSAFVGWPGRVTLEWTLPDNDTAIHLELQWFGKPANRLPEAMWISFAPQTLAAGVWRLDKLGQPIYPRDIVRHGGRGLHGVTVGAEYRDASGGFDVETLDAPLIAPGRRGLLDFDDALPETAGGVHVNLFNNVWGTNYVMWLDDDGRFRFVLRPHGARPEGNSS